MGVGKWTFSGLMDLIFLSHRVIFARFAHHVRIRAFLRTDAPELVDPVWFMIFR